MGGTTVNLDELEAQMRLIGARIKAMRVADAIEHHEWRQAAELLGMTDELVSDMDIHTFVDAMKVRFADLLREAGVTL